MKRTEGVLVLQEVTLEFEPSPGSIIIQAGCEHLAYISASGQALLAKHEIKTKCTRCVDISDALAGHVGRVPGSMEEAARHLGCSSELLRETLRRSVEDHGGTFDDKDF